MPEFLIQIYVDGFETEQEELDHCAEILQEALDSLQVSATIKESYYDAEV
jgi:hypothetical protein